MTTALLVRRLRSIAWQMSLWDRSFLYCWLQPDDVILLTAYRSTEEGWQMIEASIDEQILFVLFVAEIIEQGDGL